jgi:hypothetical protein
MTRLRLGALVLVTLATIAFAPPLTAQSPPHTPRPRRVASAERNREFQFQQQALRRARAVTRRILRDRRASPEMKQQAKDLDALLDRRGELLESLEARHKAFVTSHQAEFDELEELRQRARTIDERLVAAREGVIQASESDVHALKETSKQSAELVEKLQQAYRTERRERHRR